MKLEDFFMILSKFSWICFSFEVSPLDSSLYSKKVAVYLINVYLQLYYLLHMFIRKWVVSHQILWWISLDPITKGCWHPHTHTHTLPPFFNELISYFLLLIISITRPFDRTQWDTYSYILITFYTTKIFFAI